MVVESDLPFGLSDQKENFQKLKCLFYGKSGAGKTVLAGSICNVDNMNPVLGIDIEGGMTSLAAFHYSNLDMTKVNTLNDGKNNFMKVYNYLNSASSKYRSVIIDSATEFQATVLDDCLKELGKKQPDLPVYNLLSSKMRSMIRRIRDLPNNVLVTALAREITDPNTGIVTIAPQVSGKMAAELPGYFDIVGYLDVRRNKEGEVMRKIYFESDGRFMAKDRTGALGRSMKDPTMAKIFAKINEKHTF